MASSSSTKFTFGNLWKLLCETYEANERDIFWAYGQSTYAKVDRLYANSDASVKAILLTNLTPITEEKLSHTFKLGTFIAALTLKRDRSKFDTSTGWLSECRLYKGCGLAKSAWTVKAASLHESVNIDEEKLMLIGLPLFKLHLDQLETDENTLEEIDESVHDSNGYAEHDSENEDEENIDEPNDLEPQSAPIGSGVRGKLVDQKKGFIKGLRRQHWAGLSYRNFFHSFLQSTRRVKKFEDLNLFLEDSKF